MSTDASNWTADVNSTDPTAATDAEVARSIILGLLLACFSLATALGNALVLHAVRTEKRLQTVCNMFIVSLASADVIVGTFVMPISAVYVLTKDWIFGRPLCQLWLAVDYTASTASILNLLILSLDRYWSVSSPLLYLPKRTKRRARTMIFTVWITSALWIIPIFGWHKFVNGGVYTIPANECDPEYKENFPLKIVTGIFNFFIPLFVMYFLYGRIFLEIRKRSNLEKFQSMRRFSATSGDARRRENPTVPESTANGTCSCISVAQLTEEATPEPNCAVADPGTMATALHNCRTAAVHQAAVAAADCHMEFIYDESIVDRTTERVQLLLLTEPCTKLRGDRCVRCNDRRQREAAAAATAVEAEVASATARSRRRIRFNPDAPATSEAAASVEQSQQLLPAPLTQSAEMTTAQKQKKKRSSSSQKSNGQTQSRFKRSSSLKTEIKAARQLGVIMGAFTACFMPYFVIFVVVAFCPDCVSSLLMLALTWIGYANSALNPILYPLCNLAFRRKFRSMLLREQQRPATR